MASSSLRAPTWVGGPTSAGARVWRALAQSASAGRAGGCRSAVVPCGVGRPRRRRWAPEHVLQDERASALALRSALGLQESADIRELVVRVLPGIVLLKPFEALHHGQAQELERKVSPRTAAVLPHVIALMPGKTRLARLT